MTTPSITAAQLERLISAERFVTFRHAEPDPDVAVALYTWNAQVTGAFAELLHHVEVLARNAMHNQLTALHAQAPRRPAHKAWFDEPAWAKHHWFDTHAKKSIAKATKRAGHRPDNPRPGKVIAALGFGFWRYLTAPRYEQSFWTPALDHAFNTPGATPHDRRQTVEQQLALLHQLRNRISHCEPIIHPIQSRTRGHPATSKTLEQIYITAIEHVSYISPTAAQWLQHQTRTLPQLLHNRPTSATTRLTP